MELETKRHHLLKPLQFCSGIMTSDLYNAPPTAYLDKPTQNICTAEVHGKKAHFLLRNLWKFDMHLWEILMGSSRLLARTRLLLSSILRKQRSEWNIGFWWRSKLAAAWLAKRLRTQKWNGWGVLYVWKRSMMKDRGSLFYTWVICYFVESKRLYLDLNIAVIHNSIV